MQEQCIQPITFCISTHNNLDYLKLAVISVREYSYYSDAPFIIYAENCTDGTNEWLIENQCKYNISCIIQSNDVLLGIGGGMNKVAELVNTEYIMFLHSDFVVSRNWDIACLKMFDKYPDKKMWVSPYQILPNIFNELKSPGKLIVDMDTFGSYYHDFNTKLFINYACKFTKLNSELEYSIPMGVSGLIKKSDWDYIGGNDNLFSPASYDDIDLFLRMTLEGFKLLTIGSSIVYHFGARGSHYPEDDFNNKSTRQHNAEINNNSKFCLKWGDLPWIHPHSGYQLTQKLIDRYKILKLLKQHNNFKL
jgi:GT2 family glycosyltransferase